jgi:hypothetical protein
MFHRTCAHLSVASLFLLSASSINTMDLNLDLLKLLPYELCHRIDTHIPPITVQEKILNTEEHAQYNLPFEFNSTEAIAGSLLGMLGGCSVRYQDPASGDSHPIHTTYETPIFHCLGPCRIKPQDEICLLNKIFHDYNIRSLKPGNCPDPREENDKCFIKYLQYSSPKAQRSCPDFEYVVDINNEAQTFYTANSSGEINAYHYDQASDSCTKTLIRPSMEEKIIWYTARDMATGGGTTNFDIQFDHTQPDILLVLYHSSTTDYSIVHRPTNYVQFFPGQKIDYRNDHQNLLPLLASESESRLRLFGNNVGIKLVTVTPPTSCCAIRVLQLVKNAQALWAQWEGTAKHKNEARDIIATFKMLIPTNADRYFYVWCSKQENGTYTLTKLYNAQK